MECRISEGTTLGMTYPSCGICISRSWHKDFKVIPDGLGRPRRPVPNARAPRLVDSKGFDEYMKELGVGLALRKMGAMAKPDCVITVNGNNLSVRTESILKTTQFSCNLGEKFEETTADGRKTQTVCSFKDGVLVQHQEWDGKESTIKRKLENGKLVVECIMNNVTCTRTYEKVE
ncbi:fatty acid-binding protein 5-like [Sorex araneus]|uniref:fatty acid-binding protein 5-like n=1 Tax=Sorex araneus TaxID=42254 RepID=UPI002433F5A4|nr:fatty acid-binding protein 5-like [Sorex araneus]